MFRNNLSIHFPLTREDFTKRIYNQLYDLSIHFPLTREDYSNSDHRIKHCLSIHFPLTREDWSGIGYSGIGRSFNPLPSHEGRLVTLQRGEPPKTFQSTSLSRGKTVWCCAFSASPVFQSTSLSRGKTSAAFKVSINHIAFQSTSLSRGKTIAVEFIFFENVSFNPLPSHEGRRQEITGPLRAEDFQSTSLSRGKTL